MAVNSDIRHDASEAPGINPANYQHRNPSPIVGIVAILVALVLLAVGISELHRSGQGKMAVGLGNPTNSDQEQIPVLQSTNSGWQIDGQTIADTDIVFRLSALASQKPGIIVKYTPAEPSENLTQALNLVNQAGFSQVSLQTNDRTTTNE